MDKLHQEKLYSNQCNNIRIYRVILGITSRLTSQKKVLLVEFFVTDCSKMLIDASRWRKFYTRFIKNQYLVTINENHDWVELSAGFDNTLNLGKSNEGIMNGHIAYLHKRRFFCKVEKTFFSSTRPGNLSLTYEETLMEILDKIVEFKRK